MTHLSESLNSDEETLFKGVFGEFRVRRHSQNMPLYGRVNGLRIDTGAWKYFLCRLPDGWDLSPANLSPNYSKLVDRIIYVCLSLNRS